MNSSKFQRFADIFACPKCSGDLDIASHSMTCTKCGAKYPVIRGIPRFVESSQYTESFSLEWRIHRTTQLSYRIGDTLNAIDFEARTGFNVSKPPDGIVLDAGCGAGRHTELLSRNGWKIVAVDMSLAVESAYENTKMYPDTVVVQADLNSLPFKRHMFDACFSLGVLHHTPNPAETFGNIARHLKRGGIMAVSVYSNEGLYTKMHGAVGDLYRYFFRRLKPETLLNVTNSIVSLFRLPKSLYLDPVKQYKRVLEHKRTEVSPVYAISILVPFLSLKPDMEWRKLDTFDYLSPRFASRHTYKEVISWFKKAGFKDITILPAVVSVRGTLI